MTKLIEKIIFFIFTPMTFLWASFEGYQSLIESNVCAGQTSGCIFGALLFPFTIVFLVFSIGLAVWYRRTRKEKTTRTMS
ncbi:MAG: hypothetical protein KGH95_03445 [Thaumarchaeota archaeon]|nr:hypothetical protein [Nitrososphaerota archaeon]